MRRIEPCGWAVAIVILACSLTVRSAQRGESLFLLTGTFLNDAGQTFPVTLYTVNSQHRLQFFREAVSGREGLYEALDDTEGKIYVAFPYNNGASQSPTKVTIIHENRPDLVDEVEFNSKAMLNFDRATGTAVTPDLKSYALFTLFSLPPPDVKGHLAFMQYIRSIATSLAAVTGEPPAREPRVIRDDWSLYGYLTFYGSPGGPGQYSTPQALAEGGNLAMHLGGQTILVDRASPRLASPVVAPRTVWIVAANRRFVVSIPLGNGRENLAAPAPAIISIHDRQLNAWKEIDSAGNMPQCRIFGSWLATEVRNFHVFDVTGPNPDTNPGHNDESNEWIKYERPDVREEFGSMDFMFDIPGIITLDNLADGRRVTLQTNEEDSEILEIREDGLMLYRANDSIFSAKIEGDKLSGPTLVVKDDDVPQVHWAFWSDGDVKAPTPAQRSPSR